MQSHTGGTDYRLQFNYDNTDGNVNAGTVYVDDVRITVCKGVSHTHQLLLMVDRKM